MTVTVIVFFHAVITVGNESVFPKAGKYPFPIFRNPNIRQLAGKNQKTATFISNIAVLKNSTNQYLMLAFYGNRYYDMQLDILEYLDMVEIKTTIALLNLQMHLI